RVVQTAQFAAAAAAVRRLVRRRQRGEDVRVLDRGQYGYLLSRTALLHPNGGEWTLSRALGEAARSLATLEERAGKDFGELVRERRRQRGLPVPVAEKVLPFRPAPRTWSDRAADASSLSDTPDTSDMSDTSEGLARPEAADLPHGQGSSLFRVQLAERRMAE